MGVPANVITFDRISTREELRQVLDLLSDVASRHNHEISDLPETVALTDDTDPTEAWTEPDGAEHSQAAEMGALATILLGRQERTN